MLTKSQLKQIIKEAIANIEKGGYKEKTPARPVHSVQYRDPGTSPDDLLTQLFNIRTQAKGLEQYEVAGHIDKAIETLEIAISSGLER